MLNTTKIKKNIDEEIYEQLSKLANRYDMMVDDFIEYINKKIKPKKAKYDENGFKNKDVERFLKEVEEEEKLPNVRFDTADEAIEFSKTHNGDNYNYIFKDPKEFTKYLMRLS
jgi:hypothetical protein